LPTPPFWLVIKILSGVPMSALSNINTQKYLIYMIQGDKIPKCI